MLYIKTVAFLVLMLTETRAVVAQPAARAETKIQFITDLVHFTRWEPAIGNEITIGFLGTEQEFEDFRAAIARNNSRNPTLKIIRLENLNDLTRINILYLSRSAADSTDRAVKLTARQPVLTICESPDEARKGIMFGIRVDQTTQQVEFDVNLKAVKQSPINVRGQVLRMARKIHKDIYKD